MLGGVVGFLTFFGSWMLLHREQVRRYPVYCEYAVNESGRTLSIGPAKQPAGLTVAQLRYDLLRWGNQDHRYDAEILRHRLYPRGASPRRWIFRYANLKPVYSDPAALVWKWPIVLTLLTLLGAVIGGAVADHRYRMAIIAGMPLDGSIVTTVDEYNHEIKGDGMRYLVEDWNDR